MHKLETAFLTSLNHKPVLWKRYIDAIFVIWDGDTASLNFLVSLNSTHPNISFTSTSDQHSVDFLDITVYKGASFSTTGILSYKPYSKATNHHLYVHANSHHPVCTKQAIIKAEAIRLMRSCSDENIFQSSLIQLKLNFRDRGYNNSFIFSAIQNLPSFENRYLTTQKEPKSKSFFVQMR